MELKEKKFSRIYKTSDGNVVKERYDTFDEVPLYQTYIEPQHTLYADRMRQWDGDKYDKCCNDVWGCRMNDFIRVDSTDVERFISLYLGKPVLLCSVSRNMGYNGYYYYRFDYKEV